MNLIIDVLQDDYDVEYFEDRNTIAFREALAYWKTVTEVQHQKEHEEMMVSLAEMEKTDAVIENVSGDARNHYEDYIDYLVNYNMMAFGESHLIESIPDSQYQKDEDQMNFQ